MRSPPLLLLSAALDGGQPVCAGTGERSHTLGSEWPPGSLKSPGSRESVYFQTERLHLRLLESSADPERSRSGKPCSSFLRFLERLRTFTPFENNFSANAALALRLLGLTDVPQTFICIESSKGVNC